MSKKSTDEKKEKQPEKTICINKESIICDNCCDQENCSILQNNEEK